MVYIGYGHVRNPREIKYYQDNIVISMKTSTKLLLAMFAIGVFAISLWVLLTMPSLQLPGLWVVIAVSVLGVIVAMLALFTYKQDQKASRGTTTIGQLWVIRLLMLSILGGVVLRVFGESLTSLMIILFGIVACGMYWLWTRQKYQ